MLNEASGRIVHADNGNFTVRQASEHMNSVPIPGRPTVCVGSVSQQVDFPRQTQKDNTVLIETASCTSRNSSNCIGYDSVHGLGAVPFVRSYNNSTEAFRKNWRKLAEEATSCYSIKSLLLELEENIRTVALSADWVKLVDGCSSDSSVSQTASSVTGSTHKRKPGRRGRKPSAVSVVAADEGQGVLTDYTWWRVGMLSKFMFQRGTLPQSLVNKAARQGGKRKIPGIYYSEGSETPKRNRRLVWRAAVEMCKTASQLALQVRYLDMHVRWSDLVRPELSLQEGKGLETEASAFRNAFICDKAMVDNEIRYGVAFGNQKHLSSRVMKSVIEIGQRQDGKEKYWFSESRIPLYLIKEYEAMLVKNLPSPIDNPMNAFSKWSKKSSKTFRGDIFSYLCWKRDGNDKHSCASCQTDVLLRNGIKCSVCEGLCHKQCTTSSMLKLNEDVQCIITCKHCHQNSSVTRCGISNESPTSPLLLQGQDFSNVDTVRKGGVLGSSNRLSVSTGGNGRFSGVKQTSSANSKSKTKSWGVIWKKPNATDTGADFRKKNILRKGDPIDGSGPDCHLCRKAYNSNLMYIHCETCQNWYHADALELEESKILNVVGFKCCRCRRIRIPICPYLDPDSKKQLTEKRIRARPSKVDDLGMDSDSGIISEKYQEEESSTPMVHLKEEIASIVDDFHSLSSMEKITKQNPEAYCENTASLSGRGPKKLPIRRHVKHENYLDSSFANSPSNDFSSTNFGENTMCSTGEVITPCVDWGAKLPVRRRPMKSDDPDYSFADPQVELSTNLGVEWNTSTNGCEDGAVLNCDGLSFEDMEFEPQTYFSFNELLESDDCAPFDGGSGNVSEKWENASELPHDEMSNILNAGDVPLIPIESDAPAVVPCMMCSHTDPSPTLCCQTCGIQIHAHCSPWVEQPSTESVWRCGSCREWR